LVENSLVPTISGYLFCTVPGKGRVSLSLISGLRVDVESTVPIHEQASSYNRTGPHYYCTLLRRGRQLSFDPQMRSKASPHAHPRMATGAHAASALNRTRFLSAPPVCLCDQSPGPLPAPSRPLPAPPPSTCRAISQHLPRSSRPLQAPTEPTASSGRR